MCNINNIPFTKVAREVFLSLLSDGYRYVGMVSEKTSYHLFFRHVNGNKMSLYFEGDRGFLKKNGKVCKSF